MKALRVSIIKRYKLDLVSWFWCKMALNYKISFFSTLASFCSSILPKIWYMLVTYSRLDPREPLVSVTKRSCNEELIYGCMPNLHFKTGLKCFDIYLYFTIIFCIKRTAR